MQRGHCADCGSVRPFRRAFGWGTFFAVLCTLGWWLLALPFYPLRCVECGREWDSDWPANTTAVGSRAVETPVRRTTVESVESAATMGPPVANDKSASTVNFICVIC